MRTETGDKRYQHKNDLHEEIGKFCTEAVGATKMKNPFYKANLLLRSSTFLEHLASVDVDHTEVDYMQACGNARGGRVVTCRSG